MTTYGRITGTPPYDDQKISPHVYAAVMAEWARGNITGAQAIAAFDPPLDATEQTEGTAIKDAIVAATISRQEVHDIFLMAETLTPPYDSESACKARLGF